MSEQKVAVVTGGTGGLGSATVRRFADLRHQLAVTYLVPEEAVALEERLRLDEKRLLLRRVDVSDAEAVNEFMKQAADRFGAIHIVCAMVGGWAGGRDVEETDDVRFERMIDVNLRSTFYTVRAAVPYLRQAGWGRILVMGSRAALDTPRGQGAFNVAKAGVIALARTLAEEVSDTDITVNALVPSVIDTPATRQAMPFADYVDWPSPEEIASVVEFLASEGAGVISGAVIPVYGKA